MGDTRAMAKCFNYIFSLLLTSRSILDNANGVGLGDFNLLL